MTSIPDTLAVALEHHHAGRFEAAEQLYRQILAVDPAQADAWHLLGLLNVQLGQKEEGESCLRRAVALRPNWAEALYNLAHVLAAQGSLDEAATCYRRAIALRPNYVEAHDNLGLILQDQGELEEAVACHNAARQLNPRYFPPHNNLGLALVAQGNLAEAVVCYRQALQLQPDSAAAHNNLGNALRKQGKLAEAVACCRRAVEIEPNAAHAHCSLGNALAFSGKPDEAAASFRRALELAPNDAKARSAALFMTQYRSSVTLQQLAEAHAEYERRHAAPLRATWRPHENVRDPERSLRVGFVSRDLHRHPVGYFLIRAMENLDRRRFETIYYHYAPIRDDLTARFQATAAAWLEVNGWTDQRLAEQVRADRIDVLFDLAGHTSGNRLLVFARKPAPIQITWAGYVGTTGLAAMDYILADRYEIPPQSEIYYQERLLRMPDGYVCYDPPEYAPPVSPLPALEKGFVTFAAFHNPPKITPQAVEVWARILRRLPDARLVLKYQGMDDASVAGRYADLFAAQGIEPARLEFLGFSEHGETLAEYGRTDVALDTFAYSGGLTTCEALWMGVPVVTCPGQTFAGRHSLSHVSNAGLTDTIADDLQQYVEIAVGLAGDLPRLAALRARLRDQVARSPLCDGKRFAENLADLLRGAWREWCGKEA